MPHSALNWVCCALLSRAFFFSLVLLELSKTVTSPFSFFPSFELNVFLICAPGSEHPHKLVLWEAGKKREGWHSAVGINRDVATEPRKALSSFFFSLPFLFHWRHESNTMVATLRETVLQRQSLLPPFLVRFCERQILKRGEAKRKREKESEKAVGG